MVLFLEASVMTILAWCGQINAKWRFVFMKSKSREYCD